MRAALWLAVPATALLALFVALELRGPEAPSDVDAVAHTAPSAGDDRVPPPDLARVEPTVAVPLVVRDPATGAPFARADIEWSLEFDDDPPGRPSAAGRGTTDATGGLVVKAKRAPRVVAVRIGYGGEWARWTRRRDSGPSPVIEVAPIPKIALQVVGDDGPVDGVMVAIGYRTHQNESAVSPKTTGGPDALALFDVPRMDGVKDVEHFATVLTPLASPLRVPLTLNPPPSAPVILRLPTTGVVVVRLVGPSGAPWTVPTQVTISAASVGTSATGATYRIARDGVATFPAVGVGVALDVIAFSENPAPSGAPPTPCVTTRLRIAGPTSAGQIAAATARVGVSRPCAVGRLVDSSGRPVAGRVVSGQFLGAALDHLNSPPNDVSTTGAEGRFRLTFDVEPPERDGVVRLCTTATADGPRTQEHELLRASWAGDQSGRFDVGDVTLDDAATPTTLVSGRFVAPPGFAFRGSWVWVARRVAGRFDLLHDLRADADAGGRFELRGERPDEDRLWLVGEAQGAVVDAAVEFAPGATDVELRLVESGGLAGSVVLPKGVDGISSLAVTIEGEPTRSWGHDGATASVGWQGTMFWQDGLRPGVVAVVVRAPGREEVLAKVENVEITAGARTKDPRLAKIDLTRLARTVTAHVVGADGKPVAGAAVWSRPTVLPGMKGVYWAREISAADGIVRRVGFGGTFEFVAIAPGFASAQMRDVAYDATLVLRSARPSEITVRLASTVERPAAPLELRVRLVWCGTAELPIPLDSERTNDPRSLAVITPVPFGADRTARFDVADPGRWRAVLMVQQVGPGGGHGQELRPPRSTEVVVTETPQPLEIIADADPEHFAAVCRELTK